MTSKINPISIQPLGQAPQTRQITRSKITLLGLSAFVLLGAVLYQWLSSGVPIKTDHEICPIIPQMSYLEPLRLREGLQAKIDALDWQVKLRANPPLPKRSYPIDPKIGDQWVAAHCTEEDRKVARSFVDVTRHVSHWQFEAALRDSVSQFNRYLDAQPSKKYLLLVDGQNKSNRWVAELALKYLDVLPANVLSVLGAEDNLIKEISEYMKEHPEVNHLLFFDDAVYSCTQSKSTLNELEMIDVVNQCGRRLENRCSGKERKEIVARARKYQISVIIPFMSDPQCILKKSNEPRPIDSSAHVFTSEKLFRVGELMDYNQHKRFNELNEKFEEVPVARSRFAVYFDHKIADWLSTFPHIYEFGRVGDSQCRNRSDRFWIPLVGEIPSPYKK